MNVVTIRPYGKDWKATLPTEIDAQIDDLMYARRNIYARLPPPAVAADHARQPGSGETGIPPQIGELLDDAGKALAVPSVRGLLQEIHEPEFPQGDFEEGARRR